MKTKFLQYIIIQMVVKTGNFRFFPSRAAFRIMILIIFANPLRGNGMDFIVVET